MSTLAFTKPCDLPLRAVLKGQGPEHSNLNPSCDLLDDPWKDALTVLVAPKRKARHTSSGKYLIDEKYNNVVT